MLKGILQCFSLHFLILANLISNNNKTPASINENVEFKGLMNFDWTKTMKNNFKYYS